MRYVTFRRLEMVSFGHSVVYLALLLCGFVLGKPEPETFVLGLGHGVLWIAMSLVCIAAARARIIPFWLAVTVAVTRRPGAVRGFDRVRDRRTQKACRRDLTGQTLARAKETNDTR